MRVLVLGSGTSTGVPVIGCNCDVCLSSDPLNQRTRASIALEEGGEWLVVDTGPEFRLQVTRNAVYPITQVLYTHAHADHTQGFDDLRACYFKTKKPVQCYMFDEYIEEFKTRFSYAFKDTGYQGAVPQVRLNSIDAGVHQIGKFNVETVRLPHGNVETCGIRVGNFAYITDFKTVPDSVLAAWRGKVQVMVASGVHFGTHQSHSVIPETIEIFQDLGVAQGVITHMSHDVHYRRDQKRLPDNVVFAYDGLELFP